jgi:transcriptional regulator with XRE-family HTH domain
METSKLGLKLHELRQSHDLTQEQLSNALNITRAAYSNFERGERIPDISFMLQLANYYQIDIGELINSDLIPLHMITSARTRRKTLLSNKEALNDYLPDEILKHLKQKSIPVEEILQLSKSDIDFLKKYKNLSTEDQYELIHLIKYKLNRMEKN